MPRTQGLAPGAAVALFLKDVLFTLLLPGSVAIWIPAALVERGGPAVGSGATPLAAALFATGGLIYAWCVRDFATAGRGTPFPADPPTRLVRRGLYRYVRNPMYVGVLAAVAGWLAWHPSRALALYLAGVALLFHAFVVFVEEALLRRRFGAAYEAYCREVPRWFPGS